MSLSANIRIAWLLPVAFFYWQPVLSELAKLYPDTMVFTGRCPGYAKGYENALNIKVVGERKVFRKKAQGYGSGFTYLSLKIIGELFQFKPTLIFASSFGVWTILALLLKPFGRWRVIIAYEGSAPGVDFLNSPVRLFARRLMVKWADSYITNSKQGEKYLVEVLNASKEDTLTVPYEIPSLESLLPDADTHLSTVSQLDFNNIQRPLFLFLGRIIPRKGLKTLLTACSILQARGCNNFALVVVGDGDQQQELETYSKTEGLDGLVHWMGSVPYEQVSIYFQEADVFVLPTLEDTWGVVILEAMLLGKAILASTGAGASELIKDGGNGYTFEPQKPEVLADLMQKFIDNPDIIPAMQRTSKIIMESHTPVISSRSLSNVVEALV
ncbi:MAG: glycosyltransferase family 4 protein [Cyanobacteria bacterium P01_D01_bin.156]